ncbi:MAG TPA: flagellar basal body P-ring formation chaperone FlgA [Bryobacteraceae bacterium]|jgi:flagella basal body P-ring formation protein FlgA|nr:flagellar basal body P-ring formation chaperone FlgA [Bryobacteraceae bacterium]
MRCIFSWIVAAIAAPLAGACVEVASDRVAAGDLLEAVPLLRELNPGTLVGFAPLPGTVRLFSGRELAVIAQRQGVALSDVPDVCVERLVRAITPTEMQTALQAALGIRGAQLEIEEFSRQPLPLGRLEFQRSSLGQPPPSAPDALVIWRGRLIYDQHHSAAVWAKVRIAVDRSIFLAAEDISAGSTIRDVEVKAVTIHEFPFSGPRLDSSAEIVGKVARRSIHAGQRIEGSALDEPKDVARGDIVQVRVIDGPATLSFDGIAASSGKKGDTILVHNSASGRNFRAVVEDKGRALVRPAGGE